MEQYDSRVDAYIARSADFAQPILKHLRALVHQASPRINETIKWGFPFFEYNGALCHISAFKQHSAFGFWKASLLPDSQGVIKIGESSAGSIGKITSLADLPPDEVLLELIKEAIKLNDGKTKPLAPVKKIAAPKTAIETPDYFTTVLADNPAAKDAFDKFSPSHRREYLEWIVDAKTDATRTKRIQTTIEQLTEGKSKNWKYQ